MTVIRKKHTRKYTVVPNGIWDTDISLSAKGMFCWMLSKPDSWEFHETAVCEAISVGKNKYRSMVRELEDIGYIRREQVRGSDGLYSKTELVVSDEPLTENGATDEPLPQKPSTVNGATDIGPIVNTDKTNTKNNNKRNSLPSEQGEGTEIKIDPRDKVYWGGSLFEPERWFSENEITFLEDKYDFMDVREKLEDDGFREWAFSEDPQQPVKPARAYFEKQGRVREAENSLRENYAETKKMDFGNIDDLASRLRSRRRA